MDNKSQNYEQEDTGTTSYQPNSDRQPDTQATPPPLQQAPIMQEKRPRRWLVRLLTVIVVIFLLAATATAVYFWQNQKVNDLNLSNVKLKSQVTDLQKQLDEAKAVNKKSETSSSYKSQSNTTMAQANANTITKKAEAYHVIQSSGYPGPNDFDKVVESSLKNTNISLVASPDKLSVDNGATTIAYVPCGVAPKFTGFQSFYYDFTKSAVVKGPASLENKNC